MAKVQTIQEKREAMEKALKRLSAFEMVIDRLDSLIECNYSTWKIDPETNEWAYDENGDHISGYPEKNDWNYDEYMAMVGVVNEIKALV